MHAPCASDLCEVHCIEKKSNFNSLSLLSIHSCPLSIILFICIRICSFLLDRMF